MSQTLQNQIIMAKSMNGIVSLSDGAGTTIENGSITTGGIDATSIYSDEYNTRGKSKMESIATIATSSTPYTIAYGTAQNIVFTGSVVQTVILPVVQTENLGATFTIIRTSAVQMIIQAPSGYTFYDENNSFQSATTLFSNTRVVTFTAINTGTSPAMWSMTYSQSPNQNLAVTISNTQNITGTKSFNQVNFNLLPSFIGTLGTVASNNFITKGIADTSYVNFTDTQSISGDKTFSGTTTFLGSIVANSLTISPTELGYLDGVTSNIQTQLNSAVLLSANNAFTGNNSFSGTTTFTGSIVANSLTISPTELGYLDGVTNNIQTQLNGAVFLAGSQTITGSKTISGTTTFTGSIIANSLTITPTELGYLDGVTSNIQSQLNSAVFLAGSQTISGDKTISGTTTFTGSIVANSLTITPTELGYLDGVTSNIQSQLNSAGLLSANNAFTGNNSFSGTTTFTGSIIANALTITPTELGYLDGVSSAIQTQLNNRVTLNTTQSITAIKQFNNNVGVFGFFVPNVQTSTTSMRIGLDSLLYNTSSACTDNIAWGTNALKGNSANPTYNLTKRNIAIGTDAGSSLYYADGTSATNTDDNVLIGYQAGKNMFYASSQNVLIGSKCGSSNNWIQKCVFIKRTLITRYI
jgi:hypothetical protein